MQETSSPWDLTLINTEQTTTIDSWEKRELFYFSEMPMAISSASSDTTMATEGVGLTQSVSGNDITIQNKIPRVVYVGDTLWSLIDGTETEVGEIAAINGNIVSILALLNTPALGDFCYIRKNNYIDGDVIRDYYAKVTLTHDGDGETELYAINFEVKESKQ